METVIILICWTNFLIGFIIKKKLILNRIYFGFIQEKKILIKLLAKGSD